jgi:ComF family protein
MKELWADWQKLKNFILDLIFPRQCLGCDREDVNLCLDCYNKIQLNSRPYCILCKKNSDLFTICRDCREKTALEAVFVVANYNNDLLQKLIHSLKYKFVEDLHLELANLIIKFFNVNEIINKFGFTSENTILVPVPLHKKRLLLRGFNQSELIAKSVGQFFNWPVINLLSRQKNTISQISLSREERRQNVKDVFCLNKDIELNSISLNRKIILIDDVVTTGSTLIECAQVLKSLGFKKIYGAVVAQNDD